MVNNAPNPIKEYYIAYFDILGYSQFIKTYPGKTEDFLSVVYNAVQTVKNQFSTLNQSPILSSVGNVNVKIRIFSDNFLVCLESTESDNEPVRILTLLAAVSEIQRTLIIQYGLFVRGSIVKGNISFNDEFVFGEGIIEAVKKEEKEALYPRIIIDRAVVDFLINYRYYSQEDGDKAIQIEKRAQAGEKLENEEMSFYSWMLVRVQMQKFLITAISGLLVQWVDGYIVLNYLQKIKVSDLLGKEAIQAFALFLQNISPLDFQTITSFRPMDIDAILEQHKCIVEERLEEFGNNQDIPLENQSDAALREKTLRKYIWVMAFHNHICELYGKTNCKIFTELNCDARFLLMTIKVQKDEQPIQTN